MSRQLIDLTGLRFGSWMVLGRHPENYHSEEHSKPRWICRCDCGNYGIVIGNSLRSGASTCCAKCRDGKRIAGLKAYHRERKKGEDHIWVTK